MPFARDTIAVMEAAVFLANSRLGEDTLTTFTDLEEFYEAHKYTGARPRTSDLESVRDIRTTIHELLTSERDTAALIVNRILAESQATPQLVRHGAIDWHIHAWLDDAPLHTRILTEIAMAMTDVIRADEMSRLGRCAARACDGILLDLSRNRSRKYCSTACTNREAVAAYRARLNDET